MIFAEISQQACPNGPFGQWLVNLEAYPVIAAAVLSGIVGIEREIRRKPAGLRTNILIGVGAALFTAIAGHISNPDSATRIIQGIVTGVGFIGAGVLIRQGGAVQGTTTAATIWVVTGIGVACGMRMYGMALSVTILALLILWGLSPLDKRLRKDFDETSAPQDRGPDD